MVFSNPSSAATTDSGGNYILSVPSAASGELRPAFAALPGTALSTSDAVAILQILVGLRAATATDLLAADVTGNGTVSTGDAVAILRYLVGLSPQLPVVAQCGSWWAFVPQAVGGAASSIAPQIASPPCELGGLHFATLTSSIAQQDFAAVLLGDVNGNWNPNTSVAEFRNTAVRLGRPRMLSSRQRQTWRIPVLLRPEEPIAGLEFTVPYDPRTVRAARLRLHPAFVGVLAAQNDTGSSLRVAIASSQPLVPGTLGWLHVRTEDRASFRQTLRIEGARLAPASGR